MAKGFGNEFIEYESMFMPRVCTFFQRLERLPLSLSMNGHLREQAEQDLQFDSLLHQVA